MADLLVSRLAPGVTRVSSVDPFDTLEIVRVDRSHWAQVPEQPGIYVLYGTTVEGKLTVYVGMSATNMRARIRSHHVNPKKNWFGVIFAVPVANPILCPAIESELISQVTEAGVVDVIANIAPEARFRGADDVHVEPAVEKIRDSLQLLLGSDIFTPADAAEPQVTDTPLARSAPLVREYKGSAGKPRPRSDDDPDQATHAWVGAGIPAWGRFEGDEPDKRFRVLAGSAWRRPVLNPENVTYDLQLKLSADQDALIGAGVLDASTSTFTRDEIFDNWTAAARIVGGKAQYSGGYHWQLLLPESGAP